MSRKNVILILVPIILGAIYVYYFTEVFDPPTIKIVSQIRPSRKGMVSPVTFAFNSRISLNSVKVVVADDFKTNKYAHPLWHLVADTNSVPIKGFMYGEKIRGMKPAVPKLRAESLQTNVVYLLLVESGK